MLTGERPTGPLHLGHLLGTIVGRVRLQRAGVETVVILDGQKMSKSRGNAIVLGMSADETAALIRKARTDSNRRITVDPDGRPDVFGLWSTAALCTGRTPSEIADEIGDGGAGLLKQVTTDAVNTYLAPHRARRAELAAEPGLVEGILKRGNERANAIADATLDEVREAMGMRY